MIIEIYPRHSMTQIYFLIAFQIFLLLLQSFISVNKTSSLNIVMQLKWKHQNETKIFISFPSNSLVFISSIDMIGFFLSLHDNDDNIIEIQLNFFFFLFLSLHHFIRVWRKRPVEVIKINGKKFIARLLFPLHLQLLELNKTHKKSSLKELGKEIVIRSCEIEKLFLLMQKVCR